MIRNFLLHGSNVALVVICLAFALAAAAGFLPWSPLCVLAGALAFYLTEYGTHRFLFHARPSSIAFLRRMQHRLHYDHHVTPLRLDLLFLPLWYVVPSMLLYGGIALLILGDLGEVLALLAGASLALLHYEWVHFIAHQAYVPRTRFGRWMKNIHLQHHFRNEALWFGVSNPLMDYAMRTFQNPAKVARSKTVRVLFPNEAP